MIGAANATAVAGGLELLLACEIGLVNRVVPAEEVLAQAIVLAESVAANSPNAVRTTKQLLYDTREMTAAHCWDEINGAIPDILASDDAREGARAFLERRAPQWNDEQGSTPRS